MGKKCELCGGIGKIKRYNGVDLRKANGYETCVVCGGSGIVLEQDTTRHTIKKYWMKHDNENSNHAITNLSGS